MKQLLSGSGSGEELVRYGDQPIQYVHAKKKKDDTRQHPRMAHSVFSRETSHATDVVSRANFAFCMVVVSVFCMSPAPFLCMLYYERTSSIKMRHCCAIAAFFWSPVRVAIDRISRQIGWIMWGAVSDCERSACILHARRGATTGAGRASTAHTAMDRPNVALCARRPGGCAQ